MVINKPKNYAIRVKYEWYWKYVTTEKIYWLERFKLEQSFLTEFNNYHSRRIHWTTYRMTHVKSGEVVEYNKYCDPEQHKVQIKKND